VSVADRLFCCTEIISHCVSVSNQLQQWTNFCTIFSPKSGRGVGDASPRVPAPCVCVCVCVRVCVCAKTRHISSSQCKHSLRKLAKLMCKLCSQREEGTLSNAAIDLSVCPSVCLSRASTGPPVCRSCVHVAVVGCRRRVCLSVCLSQSQRLVAL